MTNTQPPTQEVREAEIRFLIDRHVKAWPVGYGTYGTADAAKAIAALFSPPAGVVEALRELLDDYAWQTGREWSEDRLAECAARGDGPSKRIRRARQALSALEGMGKQGLGSSRGLTSTPQSGREAAPTSTGAA